jgi:predicted RND superfamily exporter protein
VVDDTIHFMYQFRRKFDACGDVGEAVRGTMMETGRAMIITSLVLASNFLVYTLATLNNLTVFGAITGMVIILALLADLVITPALLVILFRPHQKVEEVEVSLKKALTITLPNAKETGMQG